MIELLMLGAAAGACGAGYMKVRGFVRGRLRFVETVQDPRAQVAAGTVAALAAAPVVALLPILGAGAAVAFGAGVGFGVAHGARDIRKDARRLPDL